MKALNFTNCIPGILRGFCLLGLVFLLPGLSSAQDTLICDGTVHTIDYNGTFQDFTVPDDPAVTQIEFTAKGGDGGFAEVGDACKSNGGEGALVTASFTIGDGMDEIPHGSVIRFIIGQAGEKGTGGAVLGTGFSYGGGGGGTGILYKTPNSGAWTILSAAGGGGGAYQGRAVGFCVNSHDGQGGRAENSGGNGDGGIGSGAGGEDGNGGSGSFEISAGGGGAFSEGSGITCIDLNGSNEVGEGQLGFPSGGAGGGSEGCVSFTFRNGGFGFGGGGTGVGAGGGGGGYSGGGGGGTTGDGGGGGSYIGGLAVEENIVAGGVAIETEDGFAQYRCIRVETPVASCITEPLTVSLGSDGMVTIDPADINNGSEDPQGQELSFEISQSTFSCDDVGSQQIILTITNESGESSECSATVDIVDDISPTLNCPDNIDVNNTPGLCGTEINYSDQIESSDNCSVELDFSVSSGSFFEVGETEIVVSAIDPYGNTTDCQFKVTVKDTEAPVIDCPNQITTTNDPEKCGAEISFEEEVTAIDNCGAVISLDPSSGTFFEVGEKVVVAKATDEYGNEAECTFLVRVVDNEAPRLTCPDNIEVACDTSVSISGMATAVDNCGLFELDYEDSIAGNDCNDDCEIIRKWVATDNNGNSSACEQTISRSSDLLIADALAVDADEDGIGDPLVVGFSYKTLTINAEAVACVQAWLPGAPDLSAPTGLPNGNYTIDGTDCSAYPIQVNSEGQLTNPMLIQGITLALKLRLNPELENMLLTDIDCDIHPIVLQTLSSQATLGDLMTITNYALANLVLVPFRSIFTETLTCINSEISYCGGSSGGNFNGGPNAFLQNPSGGITYESDLRVYPNPSSQETFLDVGKLSGQKATLRILNLQGQLMSEQYFLQLPEGAIKFDVSLYPVGMYLVSVQTEQEVKTIQFIKE